MTEPWFADHWLPDLPSWCRVPEGVVCDAPGAYVVDGHARFVLPRCYAGASMDPVRAALILLRTLAHYRRDPTRRAAAERSEDLALREAGGEEGLAQLETALVLHADELRHGPLYVVAPHVSPNRPGQIHWPRTQHYGFHLLDGPLVLTSPLWRTRRAIDPEDELTRLHVDTCTAIRGLLGLGARPGGAWSRPDALAVLERKGRTLFADRHRQVALWLRQYWDGPGAVRDHRVRISALWAPEFPLVWEAMLRAVVGGRSLSMPHGRYITAAGNQGGLRLVPDIVLDLGGRRFVIDAKHYDAHALPRSESLTKQLLYRWFASRESGHGDLPFADIVNVFVLPTVGRQSVEQFAVHVLDGEDDARAFGRVFVLLADLEQVAEAYVTGRTWRPLLDALAAVT